jgi:PAS domain S-box-containing protein
VISSDYRRVVEEGLTRAAEALAAGTAAPQFRDAAEHLARALGATSLTILAVMAEGRAPHILAESDPDRFPATAAALVAHPAVRRAIDAGSEIAVAEPEEAAGEEISGTWAVFPVLLRGRPVGALVARLAHQGGGLPESTVLAGRAAAALLAVVLPRAAALESVRERTQKVSLGAVAEERRLRAIERYRAFIDSASDGIVVLDTAGRVLSMNRAAEQLTGYAQGGLAGRPLAQLVPEPQQPVLAGQLALAAQALSVGNFDLDLITTSGDRMMVSVSSIGILSEHGAVIFAFRDVTLARQLEQSLRRTTEFLERIVNSAVDGIIAADLRGTVLVFNDGAQRICGYDASEVVGKMSVTELYPPGVAQEIMRLLRSSQHGGGGRLEPVRRELKAVTGELIPVSISAALVFDDAGREIATVGIFSDLRERLRMEERLASAQEKLAVSEKQAVAIELAGAAAHELNQPLTSVMGYAQMLQRKLDVESPHLKAVETILAEAERMAGIVRQLGSLTRYETKSYVGGAQIIDLDRSAGAAEAEPEKPRDSRDARDSGDRTASGDE